MTIADPVLDTCFGRGGTAGNRTIEIRGRNFDRTMTASLMTGDTVVAEAIDYYRVGPRNSTPRST